MEWYWALSFLLGLVMIPMFLGVPVAIAFFGANIIGAFTFLGGELTAKESKRADYVGTEKGDRHGNAEKHRNHD